MKMTDLLEKDKDKLLTELSAAASAEKAIHVLENEIDRLLLKHNEQCETDRERESAAYMMQAVRLSLPLIDSNGKIKVWESGHRSEEDTGGSFKLSFLVLLIIGLALCVFGFGPLMMDAYTASAANARDQVILHGGATVVGLVALSFDRKVFHHDFGAVLGEGCFSRPSARCGEIDRGFSFQFDFRMHVCELAGNNREHVGHDIPFQRQGSGLKGGGIAFLGGLAHFYDVSSVMSFHRFFENLQ